LKVPPEYDEPYNGPERRRYGDFERRVELLEVGFAELHDKFNKFEFTVEMLPAKITAIWQKTMADEHKDKLESRRTRLRDAVMVITGMSAITGMITGAVVWLVHALGHG
jgi:hypothetical protein